MANLRRRWRWSWRGAATAAGLSLALCGCSGGAAQKAAEPAPAAAVPSTSPAAAAPLAAAPSVDPPASDASVGPALAAAGADLLLTWVEPSGSFATPVYQVRFARFSAGRWSAPVTIAQGADVFANWADFPGTVAGTGARQNEILAHWLVKKKDNYVAKVARSIDGGATWSPLGLLQADPDAGEHGFVSYAVEDAGFRAFWLEGSEGGSMSLRSALITGGRPGTAAGVATLGPVELVDNRVCDCCQTGAVHTSGGPVVVYRDRSEGEIRDISVARRAAGGAGGVGGVGGGWARPVAVHADGWEIPGCPVNGPAIAADGNRLAVAWFTQAAGGPRVQVAFSADGGASFGPPAVVDAGRPVGRVDVKLDRGGAAIVSWVAPGGADKPAIWLRRATLGALGAAGAGAPRLGAAYEVPGTRSVRASGFPRLGLLAPAGGEQALLAWVDDAAPAHLRASLVPLRQVP